MRRLVVTLLIFFAATVSYADTVFSEGFEYANHDGETPVGWVCSDNSWICGYLDKDHNRTPHTGNWYCHTNSAESWMFMETYMSLELKYRFSLWAISDGGYQLEIWAGNEASSSAMTQLMLSAIVSSGDYEQYSAYIDEMTSNYQYFGIHAVQSYCGDCLLTIDDIAVDMVGKYDITVNPANFYTLAAPCTQVDFKCIFTNLGYEPANVFITSYSDYFTDVHLYKDGTACTSFHAEPDESVDFTGIATLTPNIEIGSMGWVDIMFTLDCDCATTMFTLWATAGYDAVEEHGFISPQIYPNPSNGSITIEGSGIVTISNVLGQEILKKQITDKETVNLDSGVYFVKINEVTKKVIIR